MNTSDYRRAYQSRLDETTEPAPPDIDDALAVLRDRSNLEQRRLEALQVVNVRAANREDALDALLAILRDPSEPISLRRAALSSLEINSFRVGKFQPRQAEYTQALKQVMNEDDAELREHAVAVLAAQKDVDVQRRLVEGLRDPSVAMVSPQRSVELLGYDLKADQYSVLREVVESDADVDTRREAIRLLAADQSAQEMIERVVRDKDQPVAVREAGASALQATAPRQFEAVAQEIVIDDQDDDDLRAAVLAKLAHQDTTQERPEFTGRVVSARDGRDVSPRLREAAEYYIERRTDA